MIQVVMNAVTIHTVKSTSLSARTLLFCTFGPCRNPVLQVQKKAGKIAALQLDSSQLYKWIKEHNKNKLEQVNLAKEWCTIKL